MDMKKLIMIIAAMALSAIAMRAQVLTAEQAVQQNPQVGVDENVRDQEVVVDQEFRPFDKYVDVAYMSQTKEGRFGRPLNEVSFGYGYLSAPQLLIGFGETFGKAFAVVFTLGAADLEEASSRVSTGAFTFEYMGYVHPHVALGVDVCAEYFYQSKRNGTNSDMLALSVMPAVKFQWFTKPHFGMYSKLAVGAFASVPFGQEFTKDNIGLAMSVNPVGFEFGGYNYKGFVETGFGMQGMLSAGFKYCF